MVFAMFCAFLYVVQDQFLSSDPIYSYSFLRAVGGVDLYIIDGEICCED